MENELNIAEKQEINTISDEKLIKYLDLFQTTTNFSEIEKKQFLEIAKMSNLNPFKREIYISAYGEGQYRQCSIIVGYEVYIKRAEMSGLLNGWKAYIEPCQSISVNKENGEVSHKKDIKAVIEIERKDFDKPFIHEVVFSEYVQKTKAGKVNKFWAEKPQTMLKKVAISQGFRMCFNEILGGLPYTKEEVFDEQQTIDLNNKDAVLITDSDLKEEFEEAKSGLIDCDSKESLTALYESYPAIKDYEPWLNLLSNRKKEIENANQKTQ
jgi:phage recombination protein Bet